MNHGSHGDTAAMWACGGDHLTRREQLGTSSARSTAWMQTMDTFVVADSRACAVSPFTRDELLGKAWTRR